MKSLTLGLFKGHLYVALGIWFRGDHGGTGWVVGLDDLKDLIFKGNMQNILEKPSQELKSVTFVHR